MIWYHCDLENLMWTENQVEVDFKILSIKKLNLISFTQIVFKLLSGPKFDWIWTVRLLCDILTETWDITDFGHLVVNAKWLITYLQHL